MNSQEYRNLSEAYLDVYQELDELHRGRHGQTETEYMDSRSDAGKQISGDSKTSGAAYSHRSYKGVGKPAKPGERQETQGKMDKNTRTDILYRRAARLKKEELSLDERVLGQDPEMRRARTKDEKRLPPSSGKEYAANQKKSISYMNKLTKNNKIIPGMAHEEVEEFDEGIGSAIKSLFGKKKEPEAQKPLSRGAELRQKHNTGPDTSETSAKRKILDLTRARAERDKKEYGDSTYSKSVATKSREAHNKYLRAGYNKYGADRSDSGGKGGSGGSGSGNKARKRAAALNNSYDLFDYMMEYLIIEGYADTNENALVIMANMSEDWKWSILSEAKKTTSDDMANGNLYSAMFRRDKKVKGAKYDDPSANKYLNMKNSKDRQGRYNDDIGGSRVPSR